ncbi:MAG: ABC transporter ATP-binding protein [Verrucomicrobia bacterium]|nr:ABC transporter ATP-binding protein [Verrucomicrobiota bacterium]
MHIQLQSVTKRYGSVRALDAVSFEILPGQVVAVLGQNGAGKTTLLRILAGVAGTDRGEILYDGEPFRRENLGQRTRLRFLPDFPPLFPGETVLRNIGIVLRLYDADGAGAEERILALLEEFDLLPFAEASAHTLSRGQAYKVALVSLIAADPELWLLDEPLASGMDPLGISAFRRHVKAAAGRGRTILFSTQLLDTAERIADRVALISRGALRAFETVASLRERATAGEGALDALFLRLRDEAP